MMKGDDHPSLRAQHKCKLLLLLCTRGGAAVLGLQGRLVPSLLAG